ncbi:MAG: sensor histidine kinase [Chloroflexota bacterium]
MKINIRTKLLLVFMSVFTVFLLGVFLWFQRFSTQQMMNELQQNLIVSADTAASMINADQHTRLIESGESYDADYLEISEILELVRDSNPRLITAYTAVKSSSGDPNELIFVVEAEEDVLGEPYTSTSPEMIQAFDGPIADASLRTDEYGTTLSGYAPIVDEAGNTVAIVGVDMDASDILAMQRSVRTVSIVVFLITLAGVFAAATITSGAITKSLTRITDAARDLENDQPYNPTLLDDLAKGRDEIGILAHVFDEMAEKVYKRQEKLKQEVAALRIEIDQAKREKQVSDIVETDFFKDLKAKSTAMRKSNAEEKKKK